MFIVVQNNNAVKGVTTMSAFMIVTATVKDGAKMQEYSQKALQTFAPFDGELVVRGLFDRGILGDEKHSMAAVIRFPDIENLTGWYGSDAYQALAEIRNAAADMTMTAYQVPASPR